MNSRSVLMHAASSASSLLFIVGALLLLPPQAVAAELVRHWMSALQSWQLPTIDVLLVSSPTMHSVPEADDYSMRADEDREKGAAFNKFANSLPHDESKIILGDLP